MSGGGSLGGMDYDAAPPSGEDELPEAGVPAVDNALAELDRARELPVGEHVAVFESVHQRLREALTGSTDGA